MKLNYKHRLFLYIFLLFALFTAGVIIFEQSRERKYKTEALVEKLDAYASVVNTALQNKQQPDSILSLLPANIRLTLIDHTGKVFYDNVIDDISHLEHHLSRPEIKAAQSNNRTSDVRLSSSNQVEYLYYAKWVPNYYIRVALPYDVHVQHFLKADNFFLYYVLILFAVMLLLINYVSGRFGKSINQLRNFTHAIENEKEPMLVPEFSHDELGEISAKIAENYQQLKRNKKEIAAEREKLLQHVYSSEEGLCFFSEKRKVQFYNGLFIQYLTIIGDEPNTEASAIFSNPLFEKVTTFLSSHAKDENYFETQIAKQGKYFALRVNIFDDRSFEIIINDITRQEKTRLLKQEMTGNIAHELRTPVTSIRGYLETVLQQSLSEEKTHQFLEKAYNQTLSLSGLIQDMSLITKMEEAPASFQIEQVNINTLLEGLKSDLEIPLQEKNITMEWNIPPNTIIGGNRNLLYSIFRNLTENTIRYAGNDVNILIKQYNEDKDFRYFSFADNGVGIPNEHHLNRLFERFYRINEGRTRDTGGSGLGLSIVKNAVLFHKGSIVAKNRLGGGLEFLFRLPKGE
ncbi:MAG: HAMP domain-containing histidine kinase [Prevotellaceae bacterium]|jgi:signal transduction histidine kinase|nr:HAMP domain-containing histidine kinase [Prevotellaceae bacterium]